MTAEPAAAPSDAGRPLELIMMPTPHALLPARVFAASAARHLGVDEPGVEDVRLAVSEIVTSAVEGESERVTVAFLRVDGNVACTVEGAGPLDPEGSDISRADLLRALVDDLRIDGATVRFRVPANPLAGADS
jgi:anti-sigma regulatory factor (Ser/Thr protein kinase)